MDETGGTELWRGIEGESVVVDSMGVTSGGGISEKQTTPNRSGTQQMDPRLKTRRTQQEKRRDPH